MAYTVLYIAFGVVALWLLGEVLLQYKARLRWRLLAFAGFLGVVLGVNLPSVLVIVVGAVAFGAGQTFVTLSYRRGFVEGWALRSPKEDADQDDEEAPPLPRRAAGRRGRDAQRDEAQADDLATPYEEPINEAPAGVGVGQSYDSYATGGPAAAAPAGMDSTQVYQPMPMHEDSGEYPMYNGQPNYTQDPYAGAGAGYQNYDATTGYGDWNGGQQQQQQPAASYEAYGQQQNGGWEQQQTAYGTYAGGYEDPYQGQGAPQQQQYGYDTPAGGVWVPQQGGEQQPYIPQQQNTYDQQGQQQGQGQGQYDPYDPYRYN
ncbi:hypothetical protein [Actinacidiphila sp. bgisy160]|uniref:hypothetical protein n=1 Tax=Actinacidiphila sp. bgisy160 TaxID=3413796 RepID=UPI003D74F96D